MKRTFPCARAALALALVLTCAAGAAQAQSTWGLRGGMTIDPDQVHIGAHLNAGELFTDGWFIPNVEIGFGDDLTLVALNPELVYKFDRRNRSHWGFYVGGGLGLNFYSWDDNGSPRDNSETEVGVNFLGGMSRRLAAGNELFLEMKLGAADSPDIKFTVGFNFR
jgi:hypothetical protein